MATRAWCGGARIPACGLTRAWARRAGGCFMAVGLLVSAAVLSRVGLWDVMGALTFGGRVMGAVFLAGALVEVAAAVAAADFWGKRRVRYCGPVVVLSHRYSAVQPSQPAAVCGTTHSRGLGVGWLRRDRTSLPATVAMSDSCR